MNELELAYLAIGRKQMELDLLNQEYNRLLGVLNDVVSGTVEHSQVAVNIQSRSWEIKPILAE